MQVLNHFFHSYHPFIHLLTSVLCQNRITFYLLRANNYKEMELLALAHSLLLSWQLRLFICFSAVRHNAPCTTLFCYM